jgi:hypothetical protein
VPPEGRLERGARSLSRRLASGTTRRSFLATAASGVLAALGLGGAAAEGARRRRRTLPGTNRIRGGWYGFCGHYFTTGSCPGPYELPRIDARGYPLRPHDGRPIDDLGRLVDGLGRPVSQAGALLLAPDGTPLPRAPRTRLCEDQVPQRFGVDAVTQGAWYRCCGGQIRKLTDCCTTHATRINGDAGLRGYCRPGRRVFCVLYHDTGVPC